ncbi:MAG: hypothetical protein RL745_1006 [Actinomycetota bacterium]
MSVSEAVSMNEPRVIAPTFEAAELWRDDFDGAAGECASIDYRGRSFDSSAKRGSWVTGIGDGTGGPGPGWGNDEQEYYIDEAVRRDGNGNLVITAERTCDDNGPEGWRENPRWQYVSGKITTADRVAFQYGLIEARMHIPTDIGSWSAFWLLGESLLKGESWPSCGEIDVVEAVGQRPHELLGTIHGPGYFADGGLTRTITLEQPLSDGFHTYGVLWLPDEIFWLFDGDVYHHLKAADTGDQPWVFNQPFYAILNLAMGGNLGGDLDESVSASTLLVDFVRHSSVRIQSAGGQWSEPIGSVFRR